MRGVIIAGTHSGCGKTTVTLGLLAALRQKGLKVQSFKTGPDFIDSGLHRLITGRPSRNLDLWMCGEEYVKDCFGRHSADADVSVVEGVMGLYDGAFSTSLLARALELPIVLIVDAYGMAESAGAVVKGFVSYVPEYRRVGVAKRKNPDITPARPHPDTPICGVVFNRVASGNHYRRLRESVPDLPVLGYLPRDLELEIPHRHLGLMVAEENPLSEENIAKLARAVSENIDIDAVIGSKGVKESGRQGVRDPGALASGRSAPKVKIAFAYDKAFCFYYEDNFDLLRSCGAEVVGFSPLHDRGLPEETDALYIGGGYPELHARELAENREMHTAIRAWADAGRPLYAECGGLMYLSRGVRDFDGNRFAMCGVLPFETKMREGRAKLGYREVLLDQDCLLGKKGGRLRGHEFHYSEITEESLSGSAAPSAIYSVRDSEGRDKGGEGYRFGNTLASYIHIHFGSNPAAACEFVDFAERKG